MGICITFLSKASVTADVVDAIREDNRTASQKQPWVLCEPPHFHFNDGDGRLHGTSKLNLHPHPDDAAQLKHSKTERNDLEELISRLSRWSSSYQIEWEITLEGEPIGVIVNGQSEPTLLAAIEALVGVAQELGGLSLEELLNEDPEALFGKDDN